MATTQTIEIGRRSLDIEIQSVDLAKRSITWRIDYEREYNEHGRLICCGLHDPRLEKIIRDDGALIEAALWEIIGRKEI